MATVPTRRSSLADTAAVLVAAGAAAIVVLVQTQAAASRTPPARVHSSPLTLTTRWAGYLVRARGVPAAAFSEVRGRWVEPAVSCSGRGSSVSFWIGLGGADPNSRAVEQIGSSADCPDGVLPSYSLWYELFPAPPVELRIRVRPGDELAARVEVHGRSVSLALENATTGRRFALTVPMRAPETDSAEWIVEAPSVCLGTCGQLALADFRRVSFAATYAATRADRGPFGSAAWRSEGLAIGFDGRTLAAPAPRAADPSSFAVER